MYKYKLGSLLVYNGIGNGPQQVRMGPQQLPQKKLKIAGHTVNWHFECAQKATTQGIAEKNVDGQRCRLTGSLQGLFKIKKYGKTLLLNDEPAISLYMVIR